MLKAPCGNVASVTPKKEKEESEKWKKREADSSEEGYLVPPDRRQCRLQQQQPPPRPRPELWSAGPLPETHTNTPTVNTPHRDKARGGEKRSTQLTCSLNCSRQCHQKHTLTLRHRAPRRDSWCLVTVTPITVRQKKKRIHLPVRDLATLAFLLKYIKVYTVYFNITELYRMYEMKLCTDQTAFSQQQQFETLISDFHFDTVYTDNLFPSELLLFTSLLFDRWTS